MNIIIAIALALVVFWLVAHVSVILAVVFALLVLAAFIGWPHRARWRG